MSGACGWPMLRRWLVGWMSWVGSLVRPVGGWFDWQSNTRKWLKYEGVSLRQEQTKCAYIYLLLGRPDMTFAVDWALNNNYLSICPCYDLRG